MTRLRLAGLAAAALALIPLLAAANDQDDALKLAARVVSFGIGGATVTLHAVPKELPSSVPLPQAALLGSIAYNVATSVNGNVGVVGRPLALYYDAPGNRDAVVRTYDATLRRAGWKVVPQERRFSMPRGGFEIQLPTVYAWCSPGAPLMMVNADLPQADQAALNVHVTTDARSAAVACGEHPQFPYDGFPKSPLPTFSAANGVTIDHSGPALDGTTTGARITSSLGLDAVFESFAKQLRDAGWTPQAAAASPGNRSQTFTKTAEATPYVALLSIYALDATHFVALTDVSSTAL